MARCYTLANGLSYLLRSSPALDGGQPDKAYRLAASLMKPAQSLESGDRQPVLAAVHAAMGSALVELDRADEALQEFQKDLDISRHTNNDVGLNRAYANLARASAAKGLYSKVCECAGAGAVLYSVMPGMQQKSCHHSQGTRATLVKREMPVPHSACIAVVQAIESWKEQAQFVTDPTENAWRLHEVRDSR